jgi:parallel beta-helix repeat protein
VVIFAAAVFPVFAEEIYVSPGDSIQAAIDGAADGDTVYVAPGTYYEAIDFFGKAIKLSSSGGPDVTVIDGTGYYHVVQCVSDEGPDTILDGFTVTGGNADHWESPGNRGGGMYNDYSNPTVNNCIFNGNFATSGGGMFNSYSSPTVIGCTFSNNDDSGMYNGESSNPEVIDCDFNNNLTGMYNTYSNPVITGCTFSNNDFSGLFNHNSALIVSGCTFSNNLTGMYNSYSSPPVTACTFSNNVGGGMSNVHSSPMVTKCSFDGNGCGMQNELFSNSIVSNCLFVGNTAQGDGGGMYNNGSEPTVANCIFTGNTAIDGGGMYNTYCSPTVTNCLFSGNSATKGGGINNDATCSPRVTNCTFTGNSATIGGGMYNYFFSSPWITNCILWGDTPGEIYNVDSSSIPVVWYSDIQGGYSGSTIDTDPLFVNPGYWDPNGTPTDLSDDFWVDGDYRLLDGSPCIDAGSPSHPYDPNETDLDGNSRIQNGRIDMGVYEFIVNDPIELLGLLADDVINIGLHRGIENSLLAKLGSAIKKLEDDNEKNDKAAINSMQAFVNAVNAQSGKKISEEDADNLTSSAQRIIDLLSG